MHEPSGYALRLISSFDSRENKHSVYRVRDCIEKFFRDLKEHRTKIVNYEEKEMIPFTVNESKFYEGQEKFHICKKEFCYEKNKK